MRLASDLVFSLQVYVQLTQPWLGQGQKMLHWIWIIYLYMRMTIGQIAQVKEVWME